MVGSEEPLQFFFKGHIVKEGSSGTYFDHGQFEITKLALFIPHTTVSRCITLRDIKDGNKPKCLYYVVLCEGIFV